MSTKEGDLDPQIVLERWAGKRGEHYTRKTALNRIDPKLNVPMFREFLEGTNVREVLEVGCNVGRNLRTLSELLPTEGRRLVGIEPNEYALDRARSLAPEIEYIKGDCYDLPFPDGSFDLVLARSVLIHIPPSGLQRALNEMYRVSRHYVGGSEYVTQTERVANLDPGRWDRNYPRIWQDAFPQLKLVREGEWIDPLPAHLVAKLKRSKIIRWFLFRKDGSDHE